MKIKKLCPRHIVMKKDVGTKPCLGCFKPGGVHLTITSRMCTNLPCPSAWSLRRCLSISTCVLPRTLVLFSSFPSRATSPLSPPLDSLHNCIALVLWLLCLLHTRSPSSLCLFQFVSIILTQFSWFVVSRFLEFDIHNKCAVLLLCGAVHLYCVVVSMLCAWMSLKARCR